MEREWNGASAERNGMEVELDAFGPGMEWECNGLGVYVSCVSLQLGPHWLLAQL